tara:strand:- start:68 stop:571 length:504 start_codon:yes stop_codon:yes gene_type:complete
MSNRIDYKKIKGELLKRSCPVEGCDSDTLDLVKLKSKKGSTDFMYVFVHPTSTQIEAGGSSVIKISPNSELFGEISEEEPIDNLVIVYCHECEWEANLVPVGNLDPMCVDYTPNALKDTTWKVRKDTCFFSGRTAKGKFLSKDYDNEENKLLLKKWCKARGIRIDLT